MEDEMSEEPRREPLEMWNRPPLDIVREYVATMEPDSVNRRAIERVMNELQVLRGRTEALVRTQVTAIEGRDQALAEVQQWREEWARWGERVLEEANERDWCSSYDDWARESNANFHLTVLPPRMRAVGRTFVVSFSGEIPYGNDEWDDTLQAVLKSMRDHSETEWVEDWTVEWSVAPS